MSDIWKIAESLYEDNLSDGDNDSTWEKSVDQAREIEQCRKEEEERQRDLWADSQNRRK